MGLGIAHRFLCCLVLWSLAGCAERTAYRHLEAAIEHEQHREAEAALKAFRAAVEALPEDPYLRRELGRAYLRRKMYGAGVAELEQVLRVEPSYVDAYRDLAMAFEAQEMPDAAVGWLERAVEEVPGYLPVFRDLVDLHLSHDRPDEAQRLLEKTALKRWPEAVWVHYRLGHLYQQLKSYEQAEAAFKKVLEINPRAVRAHAFLGNVLYEQERYDEAIEAYWEAIALDPQDHSSLNNLAWVYAVQGIRLEEGIRLSRRSIRLAPGPSPEYLDTLAELYFRRGEVARAIEIIRHAVSLQPENPQLKEHLQNQLKRFVAAGRGKV